VTSAAWVERVWGAEIGSCADTLNRKIPTNNIENKTRRTEDRIAEPQGLAKSQLCFTREKSAFAQHPCCREPEMTI
jgi:hypothetical protein